MAVPADTVLTLPVPEPIVATAALPLVHQPPPVASLKFVVAPIQTFLTPVIEAGKELTVTTAAAEHPVLSTYNIVVVSVVTPDTTPVPELTVATPVFVLLHVPLAVVSLRLVVVPTQRPSKPRTGVGDGVKFTVLELSVEQPTLTAVAV